MARGKVGKPVVRTSALARYCSGALREKEGHSLSTVQQLKFGKAYESWLQVRVHDSLDGSSLAHAIQVSMGPLLYCTWVGTSYISRIKR